MGKQEATNVGTAGDKHSNGLRADGPCRAVCTETNKRQTLLQPLSHSFEDNLSGRLWHACPPSLTVLSEDVAPSAPTKGWQASDFPLLRDHIRWEGHSPRGNQDLLGRGKRFCTAPKCLITTVQRLRKCLSNHKVPLSDRTLFFFLPLHVFPPDRKQVMW